MSQRCRCPRVRNVDVFRKATTACRCPYVPKKGVLSMSLRIYTIVMFQVNHHLDRNTNLEVSWEYRCSQCNVFLQSEDALESHIQQQHTFPVRPGTIAHYKASVAVKQRYLSGLPKVSLRDGTQLQNRYKSVCLGMTLTATGDDSEHVRTCIGRAEVKFGQHRKTLRDNKLPRGYKVATYKVKIR